MTASAGRVCCCIVVSIAAASCGTFAPCGRTSVLSTQGLLQITAVSGFPQAPDDGAAPSGLSFEADPLYDSNLRGRAAAFADIWNVLIEGAALPAGAGLALTLQGRIPERPTSLTRLVLILPTPLRNQQQIPIGRTFPVPIGSQNPDVYGTRYFGREPLAQNGSAEIALFYGRREFVAPDPIAHEVPEFVATSATGSLTVLSDAGQELRLYVDVVLSDAAGRQLRLEGELLTQGSTSNNSCTS